MEKKSYVIQVYTGREDIVTIQMRERVVFQEGEELYIPQAVRKKNRGGGNWDTTKEILFPGYLFLDVYDIISILKQLRRIPEFTRLLKTGDEITPLTEEERDVLCRLQGSSHVTECSLGLKDGDGILIVDGPLKGFAGSIRRIDRHKRKAILKVPMFGRDTEIEVGLEVIDRKPENEKLAKSGVRVGK
ncbi:MAG: antiterminator LoaP [Lachnospiraceae bacterium]|nr:antiterminator LoaP [Lachnospiraceae bacterium]